MVAAILPAVDPQSSRGPTAHRAIARANRLIIGEGTVKTHVRRIFDKLGVRDRPAAIVFAFDHGVVQADPSA